MQASAFPANRAKDDTYSTPNRFSFCNVNQQCFMMGNHHALKAFLECVVAKHGRVDWNLTLGSGNVPAEGPTIKEAKM